MGAFAHSKRPDRILTTYLARLKPEGLILIHAGEARGNASFVTVAGRSINILDWLGTIANLEITKIADGSRAIRVRDERRQVCVPTLRLQSFKWSRRESPARHFEVVRQSSECVTLRISDHDYASLAAEHKAWRAAPVLFPQNYFNRERLSRFRDQQRLERGHWSAAESEPTAQDALEAQQPGAMQLAILDQAKSGFVFPRLMISTHTRPPDQPRLTELWRESRWAEVPKVVLAASHQPFSVATSELADSAAILYSDHGELAYEFTAHEVYLVGAYESACVRDTLEALVQTAIRRGLRSMRVHYLVDYTTPLRGELALRELRDDDMPTTQREALLELVFKGWHFDPSSFERYNHGLSFKAKRGDGDFELDLSLE